VLRRTTLVACSGAQGWPIVIPVHFATGFLSSLVAPARIKDMRTAVLCVQCDKPEKECACDRYCCYCQGLEGIRFCADGKYYCPDCREACDIRVADPNDG
jgi:hypothetical protein